jgi:predicted N-acyltransferase
LLATEKANIKGFNFFYIAVMEQGKILAATSAFTTHYSLDSTVQGIFKKILLGIKKIFPNFLSFNLACIGSVETEINYLGFCPDISDEDKKKYLNQILIAFEEYAKQKNILLLGVKDVPKIENYLWQDIMKSLNYKAMNGLPTAINEINFKNIDDYFGTLSYNTRKNLRRKLNKNLITTNSIKNLEDLNSIMDFYYETKNRSDLQFGELTEDFFKEVFKNMEKKTTYTIYSAEGKIIGFNLAFVDQNILIDKFIFSKDNIGRKYNLYFISWIEHIKYCIDNNIKIYQSGQGAYETKLSLGCKLLPNYIYFKHQTPWIYKILQWIRPLLEIKAPSHD